MKTFKIPKGYTEEEVVEILHRVADKLKYKFKFGYHDFEDIRQEAIIFGLDSLEKYNGKHPLENFLWVTIHNKLFNFIYYSPLRVKSISI